MEWQLWSLCATAALAASLVYLLIMRRPAAAGGGRLPPGPRPLPLIGNLLDLRGNNLHESLARLARAHGPVMSIRLGLPTAVVVSSPGAASEAFARHDRQLAARPVPDAAHALRFSERSMVWLPSTDPLWTTLRNIQSAHFFSPRTLAELRGARERKVRDLARYVRGHADAGREVDVGHAVYGGVTNLMSTLLFSVDLLDMGGAAAAEAAAQGLLKLVEDLLTLLAQPNVSDLFPALRSLDLQGWRRWAALHTGKVCRILDDMFDRRLLAHRDQGNNNKRGDLVDILIDLLSTGRIQRHNITNILFDYLTTANSMSSTVVWAMAELLRRPDAMAKARAEIQASFGGGGEKKKVVIGEADVAAGLPYLQAVVKEALRLHPALPLMVPHMALSDLDIGGYRVPRGSMVIFNSWAMMRDPAAWDRADEFLPERFLDAADSRPAVDLDFSGKELEYVPFGTGRRRCPGLPLAETVVPFVLATLLHEFEWRLPDGVSPDQVDVSETFNTINTLAVPLKAVPIVTS